VVKPFKTHVSAPQSQDRPKLERQIDPTRLMVLRRREPAIDDVPLQVDDPTLNQSYITRAQEDARQRIRLAGRRLANLINDALVSE
jgi:hypothetical protein